MPPTQPPPHSEPSESPALCLQWPGKAAAAALAEEPSAFCLTPCPEESYAYESTENLYIEGDNLEVLKLLQKDYAGKVDIIYIDPPYNTGKEFIYKDKLPTRQHADWLSMMYPRLLLARRLLSEHGVIFISIGSEELEYLNLCCNEVFGEHNHLTTLIWEKTQHFGRQTRNYYANADFILCFAATPVPQGRQPRLLAECVRGELTDAPLYNAANNPATLTFPAGSVRFQIPDGLYTRTTSPTYELLDPVTVYNGTNTNEFRLRFKSRWCPETAHREYHENHTTFLVKSTKFSIRAVYAEDKTTIVSPRQIISTGPDFPTRNRFGTRVGTNEAGSTALDALMGARVFSYPKPSSLIEYLLTLPGKSEPHGFNFHRSPLILDFFAGSSTTAEATMRLNAADSGHRRYILVQKPEPITTAGISLPKEKQTARNAAALLSSLGKPHNLCEIGKERIRRAADAIRSSLPPATPTPDLGFRVLKLTPTAGK